MYLWLLMAFSMVWWLQSSTRLSAQSCGGSTSCSWKVFSCDEPSFPGDYYNCSESIATQSFACSYSSLVRMCGYECPRDQVCTASEFGCNWSERAIPEFSTDGCTLLTTPTPTSGNTPTPCVGNSCPTPTPTCDPSDPNCSPTGPPTGPPTNTPTPPPCPWCAQPGNEPTGYIRYEPGDPSCTAPKVCYQWTGGGSCGDDPDMPNIEFLPDNLDPNKIDLGFSGQIKYPGGGNWSVRVVMGPDTSNVNEAEGCSGAWDGTGNARCTTTLNDGLGGKNANGWEYTGGQICWRGEFTGGTPTCKRYGSWRCRTYNICRVPGDPGDPTVQCETNSGVLSATLTWPAGSPADYYETDLIGASSGSWCGAGPCNVSTNSQTFSNLNGEESYTFTVKSKVSCDPSLESTEKSLTFSCSRSQIYLNVCVNQNYTQPEAQCALSPGNSCNLAWDETYSGSVSANCTGAGEGVIVQGEKVCINQGVGYDCTFQGSASACAYQASCGVVVEF